ncbi:hypothetical protein HYT26_01610 [Candidatus Pacearchaeota archaeon]|nr:hypothetical protein [Candidatus Pacearchaeota archaeon]
MEGLKPALGKKRPRCPFYGFNIYPGIFLDQEGNNCALVVPYSPCQMEILAKNLDWKECPYNNIKNREKLEHISGFSVFPKEFWPKGKTSWDGMPFKEWQEYVMQSA